MYIPYKRAAQNFGTAETHVHQWPYGKHCKIQSQRFDGELA